MQVLDDSTDETTQIAADRIAELQAAGLDIELIHRTDRTGFKAGALEAGLNTCKGEFVLILDADFVPAPDMLRKTIHFFTDPQIGMIQTRWGHLNRTYSLLTRVQAMFLDGHLLLEQTARSRAGRFFNFNGTAGLWRRSCIQDAGGWQHDTLTEDLDLSYRAQLKGWRFIFLPHLVTPAELPVDMNGFKSQQHRWTKGSIQTCIKLLPAVWRAKLPVRVKFEATAHLTSNYAYLLLFFLCILMHPSTGDGSYHPWQMWLVDIRSTSPRRCRRRSFTSAPSASCIRNRGQGDPPAAHGAGPRYRPGDQQCPGGPRGHVRPSVRVHAHAEIRHREQDAGVEKSALPADEDNAAVHRIGLLDYFSYLLGFALAHGQWLNAAFLSLFLVGFTYVALCSLAQWMPNLRFPVAIPALRCRPERRSDCHDRPPRLIPSGLAGDRYFPPRVLHNSPGKPMAWAVLIHVCHEISPLLFLFGHAGPALSQPFCGPGRAGNRHQRARPTAGAHGKRGARRPLSDFDFQVGLGDQPNSYATPLGTLEVAAKVGDGAPLGAVFKSRHLTGEVLRPNTPGRDPIVTRILHLRGLDAGNCRAFDRGIYIHGTPEESHIGRPASYGCIRMRSRDIVRIFDATPIGTKIEIVNTPLRQALVEYAAQHLNQGHRVAAN
ncbi:MAG: glycosyltransferase [Chthoniobacter sp.]